MNDIHSIRWPNVISAVLFIPFGLFFLWDSLSHDSSLFYILFYVSCLLYGILSGLTSIGRYRESFLIPHWISRIVVYFFIGVSIIIPGLRTFNRSLAIIFSIVGLVFIIFSGILVYSLYRYLNSKPTSFMTSFTNDNMKER
jgi:hypothetical protein